MRSVLGVMRLCLVFSGTVAPSTRPRACLHGRVSVISRDGRACRLGFLCLRIRNSTRTLNHRRAFLFRRPMAAGASEPMPRVASHCRYTAHRWEIRSVGKPILSGM